MFSDSERASGLNVFVEQGAAPGELPPWMKFLLGKLGNPATPLNIRLFVAKLLINTEEVDTHSLTPCSFFRSPSSVLSVYILLLAKNL